MNHTAKRIILAVALACVATAACQAQVIAKLKLKRGQKVIYGVRMENSMAQTVMGNESTYNTTSAGNATLNALKVSPKAIQWSLASKMTAHTEGPQVKSDTVINAPPRKFTTDAAGRPADGGKTDVSGNGLDPLEAMTGRKTSADVARLYFSPLTGKTLKPGDMWTERTDDTNHPFTDKNGPELSVVLSVEREFTYQGDIDTLGVKTHRIRCRTTSMTITGSGKGNGQTMTMDGTGSIVNTSYYSATDGLLLCDTRTTELTVTMKIVNGPSEITVPVIQKNNTVTLKVKNEK